MASTVKNGPAPFPKVTRGFNTKLGTIALVNDCVAFTISEPTYMSQGGLVLAVSNGITGGTFVMEASIDGGVSWFSVPLGTAITTSQFGDVVVSAAFLLGTSFSSSIAGMGSGAQFRFGLSAVTSGSGVVWALQG